MALNQFKLILDRLHTKHFQRASLFKVAIEGLPEKLRPFEFFCKELTYSPVEIESDQIKVGLKTITFPSGAQPVEIAMTVLDTNAGEVRAFFEEWASSIILPGGLMGLASQFRRKVTISTLNEELQPGKVEEYLMFLSKIGEFTLSYTSQELFEFPVTLIQTTS